MNNINVLIWGREFELEVSYQNFPGEDVTVIQQNTLAKIPSVDYEAAKPGIEAYIRKYYSTELGDDSLDNLFRFVMPKRVLITRTENNREFAILCDFKFDMEHGIAVIFENEEFKAAGSQDLIL